MNPMTGPSAMTQMNKFSRENFLCNIHLQNPCKCSLRLFLSLTLTLGVGPMTHNNKVWGNNSFCNLCIPGQPLCSPTPAPAVGLVSFLTITLCLGLGLVLGWILAQHPVPLQGETSPEGTILSAALFCERSAASKHSCGLCPFPNQYPKPWHWS